MIQRAAFFLILAFWLVMNTLLIRSEFGIGARSPARIPAGLVWQRILTAPDDSSLSITRDGQRIGFARWAPNVGEEMATGKQSREEFIPEGSVGVLRDYTVNLEGNFSPTGTASILGRIRFSLHSKFSTNHNWQVFTLRLGTRASTLVIDGDSSRRVFHLRHESAESVDWDREVGFDDFRDPAVLMSKLDLDPALVPAAGMLSGAGLGLPGGASMGIRPAAGGAASTPIDLKWEATTDWMRIGHAPVKVYHLRARILERMEVKVVVSRVGEILKVELPGNLRLLNEALDAL